MRIPKIPFLRRFVKDERGQTAVLITLTMVAMTAMSAMGIETGHIYYAYRLLQASTNAAALAAGQAMPNIGTSSDGMTAHTAYGNLYAYSSIPGAYNANSLLTETSASSNLTVSFSCSSTASNLNVFCEENTNSSSGGACVGSASSSWCNAVKVTQTARVNLWFGGLLGFRSLNLTATAKAAMAGGHPPYNIAVVIDTTSSMTGTALSNDDCPSGSNTEIGCAVFGLKQMLIEMNPCLNTGNCSSSSEEADGVALFVFPAIQVTSSRNYTTDDTVCNTTNPPIVPYDFENYTGTPSTSNLFLPTSSSTYGSTASGTYQVTGFDTSYKSSDGSSVVYASDALAIAAGGSGIGACKGLQAPGGEGTYYAQVIRAAQAALVAQQTYMTTTYSQPTSNILIILSDGDATACNSQVSHGTGCTASQIVAANCPQVNSTVSHGVTTVTCGSTTISENGNATLNCPSAGCSGKPLNGTGNSTTFPAGTNADGSCYGYNCPAYPSAVGECGQAVEAAQLASAAGTTVYTVAMGSATSGSCASDSPTSTYTLTGLSNGATTWPTGAGHGGQASVTGGQACNAISAMATSASTFYSDDQGGCLSTVNGTFESMASIFTDVAKKLSTSRLIPANSP